MLHSICQQIWKTQHWPQDYSGALTGAISMAIGAKLMAPHGGLFVLLIPGAITPVLGYLVAIIAGTLVAGLAYAFLKRPEVDAVAKAA